MEDKKQVLYELITDKSYRPLRFKELAVLLMVPKALRGELKQTLDELIKEGKITVDSSSRYRAADANKKTGVFHGTSRGFGFVSVEGEKEDYFIPEFGTKGALDGDTVLIYVQEERVPGKRCEAKVLEITVRGTTQIVGTYQRGKSFGFVIPDNQKFAYDVFIPKEKTAGAVNGHKVLVNITNYGDERKNPEGEVIKVLGHINDPGVDVLSVVYGYGIPLDFPEEVYLQAGRIPEEVSEKELQGRLDLRGITTITIDGEDAKDLDDAVTLSREGDVWQLGVHIADVSEYVGEGQALDREAYERGTSVYLVDRVIPMLPHRLSNGICSLNAGQDRLALSCLMEIDGKGNVIGHRIAETVINVDYRMTYTSVKKIIEDHDEEECEAYGDIVPMLSQMDTLAGILREKRRRRGSIDFDFPECKIVVDGEGNPLDIKPYERNRATKLIEDFMLIANETVAEDSTGRSFHFSTGRMKIRIWRK